MTLPLSHGFRNLTFLFASLGATTGIVAQSQQALSDRQRSQLDSLAARIHQSADKAGCKKGSCKLLVSNFAGPTGATCWLGMKLADAVSAALAAQAQGVQIIDRNRLQDYLVHERIESKLLEDDNAARWLAQENGANVILVGYLRGGGAERNLRVRLLDTRDFGKERAKLQGPTEEVTFQDLGTTGDLGAEEPFGIVPNVPEFENALSYGKPMPGHDVSRPQCTFHPDPPYSNPARRMKLQGILVVEALISEEGNVTGLRMIKGLPLGLNAQALATVKNWRCKPLTIDGQPKLAKVPIEISFRLF